SEDHFTLKQVVEAVKERVGPLFSTSDEEDDSNAEIKLHVDVWKLPSQQKLEEVKQKLGGTIIQDNGVVHISDHNTFAFKCDKKRHVHYVITVRIQTNQPSLAEPILSESELLGDHHTALTLLNFGNGERETCS
ncbi:hypothetical protein MPER_04277, partial [Moniliophthora perniciosa FA553]